MYIHVHQHDKWSVVAKKITSIDNQKGVIPTLSRTKMVPTLYKVCGITALLVLNTYRVTAPPKCYIFKHLPDCLGQVKDRSCACRQVKDQKITDFAQIGQAKSVLWTYDFQYKKKIFFFFWEAQMSFRQVFYFIYSFLLNYLNLCPLVLIWW